jgi:hypothetical protein
MNSWLRTWCKHREALAGLDAISAMSRSISHSLPFCSQTLHPLPCGCIDDGQQILRLATMMSSNPTVLAGKK